MRLLLLLLLTASFVCAEPRVQEAPYQYWDDVPVPSRPADSKEFVRAGELSYAARCAVCHGKEGDGDSIASPYLLVKPRDFVSGFYKVRTTSSKKLPAEEDLYRSISRGFPQYGMPAFDYLSEKERWALVKYLKTLSPKWKSWAPGNRFEPGAPPKHTPELVARGKKLYGGKFDCASCHGATGMGDGPEAKNLKDAFGNPVVPRTFTAGQSYFKRGDRARDIVMTIALGMPSSPMMPFLDKLDDQKDLTDLWAVAYYVRTLMEKKK